MPRPHSLRTRARWSQMSPDPGILTQRQTAQFSKILRKSKDNESTFFQPLALHFNILDFAGQSQYRPMHHCYIARRAIVLW